ncbi:unnamed protein product [Acanthoscelides obtectus]|uniref:Uncharacterized protein n=1 Tax=Acanthoscelides obtectus TaxID=200917 RepID=A0A9P0LVR7_ACAOB|nr:unnamed protein product [Acanthoscelides obtectus]CAK1668528.1 hypothetical protein AOBTE_LOCUS26463 [Acanthoscelides obtectus]
MTTIVSQTATTNLLMMNHLVVPIQTLLPPPYLRKPQTPMTMSYPLLLGQILHYKEVVLPPRLGMPKTDTDDNLAGNAGAASDNMIWSIPTGRQPALLPFYQTNWY